MDDVAFDRLVKLLGATPSRRAALNLVVGAAVGGVTRLLPGADADARGKKKGKKKKKKANCPRTPCPQGYHRNKRTCQCECTRLPCSGGKEFDTQECRCTCPSGMRECRDGCVAPGGCCPSDPPCPEEPRGCCYSPGVDVCTIDGCCAELDGIRACNDFCIDTNTHRSHCGACNNPCGEGETCRNGACAPAECPNGQPKCGDRCCGFGEECCHGICQFQGTAICTKDGWCPTTTGQACCGTGNCADDPCCLFSAGEACCVSDIDTLATTCCPGGHGQCAPGGCCSAGTSWTSDLGCDACCPPGFTDCGDCVAPGPGRG